MATHASSLARMRESLGGPQRSLDLRALARHDTDDPMIALLDSWAVVADTVSFYSERLAQEGFLRTATERQSVRELARELGYELRPGVAAQVQLAFTAHVAPGSPEVIIVPPGTPVQSVPGPGELPQVFETTDELEVRGAWNEIAGVSAELQQFADASSLVWLRGGTTSVRPGDKLLVIASGLRFIRTVTEVVAEPGGLAGWTSLTLDEPVGGPGPIGGGTGPIGGGTGPIGGGTGPIGGGPIGGGFPGLPARPSVFAFKDRAALFGWNAPNPNLLIIDAKQPFGTKDVDKDPQAKDYEWQGYKVTNAETPDVIEVDGDHKATLPDSWIVLEQPGLRQSYGVLTAESDSATKFALSGHLTRVQVKSAQDLTSFDRRRATVHCSSTLLPAAEVPLTEAVGGGSLVLLVSDPPLPPDRPVLVTGVDAITGEQVTESATVIACGVDPQADTMTITLEQELAHTYVPVTLRVRGNVAAATHGETVEQVLGSGDGRVSFQQFRPRRPPLTYVRAKTPEGARAELTVRVDGVRWDEVTSIASAGSTDRVYTLRRDEDGGARIVMGDGTNGARLPTGPENITATYRVGIGDPGAVNAGQVTLLARRPLGIREVANPLAATDWAPPETLDEARANAPLRVRTLDRAVSVVDHEDFARGYAGVGPARGDLVWDGRAAVVVVTLLGTGAVPVSDELLADLHASLDAARDPGAELRLVHGMLVWFGVRVEISRDPAYEPDTVDAAVIAALEAAFAPTVRTFAAPVVAASTLVVVRGVPGVLACTMPRLLPLTSPGSPGVPPILPGDEAQLDPMVAQPANWERGDVTPAELLALAVGGVQVGVMTT